MTPAQSLFCEFYTFFKSVFIVKHLRVDAFVKSNKTKLKSSREANQVLFIRGKESLQIDLRKKNLKSFVKKSCATSLLMYNILFVSIFVVPSKRGPSQVCHLIFLHVNPFFPNAHFLCPLKTSENLTVFRCFRGRRKGALGTNGLKHSVSRASVKANRMKTRNSVFSN